MSNIFGKIGSTLGAITGKIAKFGGVVVGAMSTAVGWLTKLAVQNYAEYEQLVGGIETLFGTGGRSLDEYAKFTGQTVSEAKKEYDRLMEAQNLVLQNSENAFKNSGLSMNEYMNTATSFSASLLQSLGGDTLKTAQVTEMAINDMSDNANKMGTNMGMIMNAYQGFAKQNYMMLDNLKLGYGGTKGEMERLLADANKINAEQGKMTNYSIENLSDVFEAIHVVQEKMGIYGTTSKEASTTIQGSFNMMKASWQNFLTGMSDPKQDFDKLLKNLTDSIVTFAQNIIPRIIQTVPRLMKGLGTLINMLAQQLPPLLDELIPVLIEAVGNIIKTVATMLPQMAVSIYKAVKDIATNLLQAIKGSNIIETVSSKIDQFVPMVINKINGFVDKFVQVFPQLGEKIGQHIPGIVSKALDIIEGFVAMLVRNVPKLIEAGGDFIKNLVKGLMQSLPELLKRAPQMITDFANMISRAVPQLIKKGAEIIWEIVKGLVQAVPTLIKEIPKIIQSIIAVWNAVNWLKLGKTLITGIKNGITAMWGGLKNMTKNLFDSLDNMVMNIFRGMKNSTTSIWNGIKSAITSPISGAKNLVVNIVNSLKSSAMSVFNSLKGNVKSVFDGIKTAMTSPIETAKSVIGGIVEKIKGLFNFKITMPKIPLPHFGISPSNWGLGDLLKGKIPKLSIDWYDKAMERPLLMEEPTAFGINPRTGAVRVGGETGSEMVGGTDKIMGMIRQATGENMVSLGELLERIIAILNYYLPTLSKMQMVLDTGTLVGEIAPTMDKELGKISIWKGSKR